LKDIGDEKEEDRESSSSSLSPSGDDGSEVELVAIDAITISKSVLVLYDM